MKDRLIIFFFLFYFPFHFAFGQTVNGKLICDTSNVRIIQVWGTHYERGYALGYIDSERILNLYQNYIVPSLGQAGIDTLKRYIVEEKHFRIADKYKTEATGIADGIEAKTGFKADFDYLDVLAANTYFDFLGFFGKTFSGNEHGCSSLMSWGDATLSTSLNGSSVVTRHLDWSRNMILVNSSTIVAHIPEEEDEQPWIMIGFAGQISALSGINSNGLGVFHHSLSDFSGTAQKNKAYEPVWFTARNALEVYDYNNDMLSNTNDVRDAALENNYGYANGSIFSVISVTDTEYDSLSSMVMESACEPPYHTFRYNDYDDLIPGDNLYAANGSIKRDDLLHYEPRYYAVADHIGEGVLIDPEIQSSIMRDYSNSGSSNIQLMQFIPNEGLIMIAVADAANYAYQKDFIVIQTDSLFELPLNTSKNLSLISDFELYPNPVGLNQAFYLKDKYQLIKNMELTDLTGRILLKMEFNSKETIKRIPASLKRGMYLIRLSALSDTYSLSLIVN